MEIVTSDAAPLLTRLVKGYVSFLTRFRVAVALFWLCVFGISCVFGPKLATADSNNSFTSPPNSPSAIADSLMAELFPSVAGAASIVLVIQSLQTQVSNS